MLDRRISDERMADETARPHRSIRSFVLRQGRLTPAQERAHATLMQRYGVPYAPQLVDFSQLFGRSAPTVLEIGFGMGETTATIAQAQPERNYLGIEVHTPGVGSLLKALDARGIDNVRVIQHDAVEVVQHMLPEDSLAGVHIFFPDPWPKKRHHKRRLLQPGFVHELAHRLALGGYLHVATDWQDYAQQTLAVLQHELLLANTTTDFAPRPAHRPRTKFERRGLKLGHSVWDMVFVRRT